MLLESSGSLFLVNIKAIRKVYVGIYYIHSIRIYTKQSVGACDDDNNDDF